MNSTPADPRVARAAARRTWPVRLCRLGGEGGDDASAVTTPDQRIAMMWPLALASWSLAGLPLPDYDRKNIPVRVVRR